LAQFTNMTDGQTNIQTPHADIGHAYASHRVAKTVNAALKTFIVPEAKAIKFSLEVPSLAMVHK